MNGFCCWLLQVLIEFLIAELLHWLIGAVKKRKAPKMPGKHFKGAQ